MDSASTWTTGWRLLLLWLLLREGAQALECYSCVQKADDGCSPQKMKVVKCAPGLEVCTEAVGAVETIHGQFSMAVRGCGSGLAGKNDRGLDLVGILAFVQLQQCAEDRCNARLNLTSQALAPAGNASMANPNGIQCYSCLGQSSKECQGTAPPLVNCYNTSGQVYKGCFDGNVTLTAANVTVSLPVRGCVQDEYCTRDVATGPGFTLTGSCCRGSHCNSDLRNKTYFSPRIPPLVLLPPPRTTSAAPSTQGRTNMSNPAPPTTHPAPTSQSTAAPTTQAAPKLEANFETPLREESSPEGEATGHQDRSNMGQHPSKGGVHDRGSAASSAGLVVLLLASAACILL